MSVSTFCFSVRSLQPRLEAWHMYYIIFSRVFIDVWWKINIRTLGREEGLGIFMFRALEIVPENIVY